MSRFLVEGGFTLANILVTESGASRVITHTNLANRAQALSIAKERSLKQKEDIFYGYRQEKQRCFLDFIVEKGDEQPMFQVIRAEDAEASRGSS
jgi:hypothetical protein